MNPDKKRKVEKEDSKGNPKEKPQSVLIWRCYDSTRFHGEIWKAILRAALIEIDSATNYIITK